MPPQEWLKLQRCVLADQQTEKARYICYSLLFGLFGYPITMPHNRLATANPVKVIFISMLDHTYLVFGYCKITNFI